MRGPAQQPRPETADGSDLRRVLVALAELLIPAESGWSDAMSRFAARLDSGEEPASDVARDILGLFGGIGSFSDVVLQDRAGVRPEQAQLDALRGDLFQAARGALQ